MNTFKKYLLIIITSISIIVVFAAFGSDSVLSKLKTLSYVIRLVENYYVDEIDLGETIDGAIHGFLEELDPHSAYIPKDDFTYIQESMDGEFEGIGIEFAILDDYITVISPIPETPSDRAGLIGGDKIIKINGESAYKITQEEVIKKLRGKRGSAVDITIDRIGLQESLNITLIRDKIPIHSILASFLYTDDTGYIKINRFADKTFDDFKASLDSLESKGMKNLILDLRNNGGGFMKSAIDMLDLFINSNDTILYTKGRVHNANEVFYAHKNILDKKIPIIVLINRASASASEIVSGTLQDLDRGLIIGETSFGKGLVQRQFILDDGSAARITIAKYYTPSGRLIQRNFDDGVDQYYNNLLSDDREIKGDNKKDMAIYKTRGGRNVFGGGGITPDVHISNKLDFSPQTQLLLTHPSRLLFKYANNIKDTFVKNNISFNDFNKMIVQNQGSNISITKFVLWANEIDTSLELLEDDIKDDWIYLENRIMANIANRYWGKNYNYYVLLNEDKQFIKSLDYIEEAKALIK